MKIYAARREYPTYEDYVNSGEFTNGQLNLLRAAFSSSYSSMTPKKIFLLANPELNIEQMYKVYAAICSGLPMSVLLLIADPKNSASRMEYLVRKYRAGISEEATSLIEGCGVSDSVQCTILDQFVSGNIETYDDLERYIKGKPVNFINGISSWMGDLCASTMLGIFEQHPKVFTNMSAAYIEEITTAIDDLLYESGAALEPAFSDPKFSDAQISLLLRAVYLWHKNQDNWDWNFSVDDIIGYINPDSSVAELEQLFGDA